MESRREDREEGGGKGKGVAREWGRGGVWCGRGRGEKGGKVKLGRE